MARTPLDLLEGFAEVARHGNLTRAAEAMHLTVSALSHRMRQLEERLGQRLFVRGPRGVSLTPGGRRLRAAVERPLQDIERALRSFDCAEDDRLTLSLPPLMTSGWLVPRLPDFVARHPQVSLNLLSSTALVDFEREPVDAAMRLGRGSWPGVEAEFLFEEKVRPVASPALLAQIGKPRLADLGRAPLLGDPANLWQVWFEHFGGQAPSRYVAAFDNSEALHQAAVQGMGVALGRETLARPLIESGRLVALTRRFMPAGYAHYLAYPPRSLQHKGFLAFRDWLHATVEART